MYHFISGRLVEKTPTSAVVEAGGIGYHVHIPVSTFEALPETGANVRLLTHFIVREDAQLLYGFQTEDERDLFRMLLSVSGIGPKSALTIFSGIPLEDFKQAVVDGNLAVLTSIPGVGRKTAERLVIELKEKIVVSERRRPTHARAGAIVMQESLVEDCLRALIELGYRKQTAQEAIEKAMRQAVPGQFSISDLVRASLKHL